MQNPKNDENLPKSMIFEMFRESARKRTETPRSAPQARSTSVALRPSQLQSRTDAREQDKNTTDFWRTQRGTDFAPKPPPRDQTDETMCSGHPLRGNDSILGAVHARQRQKQVGDLKGIKKRLFFARFEVCAPPRRP